MRFYSMLGALQPLAPKLALHGAAGTSAGALLTFSLLALKTPSAVLNYFMKNPLTLITSPMSLTNLGNFGLTNGANLMRFCKQCVKDLIGSDTTRMNELPFDWRASVTDLVRKENYLVSRKDNWLVADVLYATMCIPPYFPPLQAYERLLVDGGVTDNCPVPRDFNANETVVLSVSAVPYMPTDFMSYAACVWDSLAKPAVPAGMASVRLHPTAIKAYDISVTLDCMSRAVQEGSEQAASQI